jgi:hypothetical protein
VGLGTGHAANLQMQNGPLRCAGGPFDPGKSEDVVDSARQGHA